MIFRVDLDVGIGSMACDPRDFSFGKLSVPDAFGLVSCALSDCMRVPLYLLIPRTGPVRRDKNQLRRLSATNFFGACGPRHILERFLTSDCSISSISTFGTRLTF